MATKSTPNFGADAFKSFADFKVPGVNVDAFISYHRKNLDAFSKANQLAVKGLQAIAERQSEIIRTALDGASKASEAFVAAKTPEEKVRKQAELTKDGVINALTNTQEIVGLAAGATSEAVGVLNARLVEGFDEVRTMFSVNGATH